MASALARNDVQIYETTLVRTKEPRKETPAEASALMER
jgi:hypothetical protein